MCVFDCTQLYIIWPKLFSFFFFTTYFKIISSRNFAFPCFEDHFFLTWIRKLSSREKVVHSFLPCFTLIWFFRKPVLFLVQKNEQISQKMSPSLMPCSFNKCFLRKCLFKIDFPQWGQSCLLWDWKIWPNDDRNNEEILFICIPIMHARAVDYISILGGPRSMLLEENILKQKLLGSTCCVGS